MHVPRVLNKNFFFLANTPPKAPWMGTELKTPLSEFSSKQQKSDDQKSRDDSWRKMKYSLIAMGTALGICGGTAAYTLGIDQ